MASYEVDGLIVPVAVGGHPALDFANTRADWGSPTPKEYLHTHAHLAVWARENGLLDPADLPGLARAARRDPGAADRVVARAIAFRSALYALLIGPASPADWDRVNTEVQAAAGTAVLTPVRTGDRAGAVWRTDRAGLAAPLLAVAWSAAGLLSSPAASTVRACPGAGNISTSAGGSTSAGCGWVFVDPRGRRRWCSMAWCGNRAKARRHAGRARTGPE